MICPKCGTQYTDETLKFCLQDGAPLIEESRGDDPAPTVPFANLDTVAEDGGSERITFDLRSDTQDEGEQPTVAVSGVAAGRDSRGNLKAVLITVIVMLVIFSIAGAIAAILYLGDGDADTNFNRTVAGTDLPQPNVNAEGNENSPGNADETRVNSGGNDNSANGNPSPEPTVTPEGTPDKGAITAAVTSRVYEWRSLAEARRLEPYMATYADKLDIYYRKRGVTKEVVRRDKRRAFNKYDSINIEITGLSVAPGPDGGSAVATFDKEWRFRNSSSLSTGKVRSQLSFRKNGEIWLIIGERDLKVYYVR